MKQTALVLVGPTGVGKTEVSLKIAQKLPVEIVSADSRQIYRFMDIGTAKPPLEIRRKIPHHFIDILNPDQDYSAGQYAREARQVIQEIFQRNKVPLVVGGSGLYIRALLEGFFGEDIKDPALREKLQERLNKEGADSLYAELQRVDPEAARKIHPNNIKRVLRALEVYYLTGTPITEWQRREKDRASFPWIKYGLMMERQKLYERINRRVEEMFEQGLVEEVKQLLQKGYDERLNALQSVGYAEVIRYLKGEMDLATCVELVKRNSRRYAKRQLTWFRHEKDIHWIEITANQTAEEIADIIVSDFLSKKAND